MSYKLAVACLLSTAAMYMQLPVLTAMFGSVSIGYTPMQEAAVLAMPGAGVFAFGCFCSYLVQHYRRNMVCIMALLLLALCSYALYYLLENVLSPSGSGKSGLLAATGCAGLGLLLVVRFVQGAVFGLAQMVLASTLVIDTCNSPRRTAANQTAAWFARFALVLGPMLVLFLSRFSGTVSSVGSSLLGFSAGVSLFKSGMFASVALCVLAALLVMSVRFPFKAPEDIVPHVSTDRFFLKDGVQLFVNFALVSATVGVLLCVDCTVHFYVMLMLGLFAALLAERFFLSGRGHSGVAQAGMLVIFVATGMSMLDGVAVKWCVPLLFGCGLGLSGARFLSLFITLSPHCRRGTAQSTFFLSWEFGLYAGVFLACGVQSYDNDGYMPKLATVFSFAALTMFCWITRKWYVRHKNR